jgi:hypothetical protein
MIKEKGGREQSLNILDRARDDILLQSCLAGGKGGESIFLSHCRNDSIYS